MQDGIEHVVREQMERWAIPGVSIATLRDGKVETGTWGIASIATGAPVQPETLFQVGSISKVFTTTLLMTFVDEGKLALDTPAAHYLPDLPLMDTAAREAVTLRHLVTHMSGFYGDRFDDQGVGDDALANAVAAFCDLPQQTAPGELWTYCNAGFDLVARVMEVVSGQRFEDLMRARVFDPLGMDSTTYFAAEAIRHPVAVGHEGDKEELTIADPWPIPRRSNGAGGISSTASQLMNFAAMHISDGEYNGTRVLSQESARAMRKEHAIADPFRTWGLGWSRDEINGVAVVEHGGATNGFTARLVVVPARKQAIAILLNHAQGGSAHPEIAKVWLREAVGLSRSERPIVPVNPELIASRVGTYSHGLGDLILTAAPHGFDVQRVQRNPFSGSEKAGKPFRLRPVSDDIYAADGGGTDGSYADFIRNPDGSTRFLRFGGRLAFPKAS
ncbi:MAG: beta-lactamase family protein [Chloroflexota bacterium]|nr:beta-lactamase family protein [Chloroflexota bacterium]